MKYRLISSDMDGTILLNGAMSIDEYTIKIINAITDMGVLFAPASGRQHTSLSKLFKEVHNDLIYICENGALIKYKGETIKKSAMDRNLGIEIMKDIYSVPNCEVLVSGENTSYLLPKSEAFLHRIRDVVKNNVVVINSFEEIPEDFIKIAVCDMSGIANSREHFEKRWEGKAKIAISGDLYLDFNALGVNKGMALKTVKERFNIQNQECAAFGDNFNDIEMLDEAGFAYVMEKAHKQVKIHGDRIISNVAAELANIYGIERI